MSLRSDGTVLTVDEENDLFRHVMAIVRAIVVDDVLHVETTKQQRMELDQHAVKAGRLLRLDCPELEVGWNFDRRAETSQAGAEQ